MTPEQALAEHIKAIAKILYEDTQEKAPEQLTSLAGREMTVRSQMQKHVMPSVEVFLSKLRQAQAQATDGNSKAFLENLPSPVDKHKS